MHGACNQKHMWIRSLVIIKSVLRFLFIEYIQEVLDEAIQCIENGIPLWRIALILSVSASDQRRCNTNAKYSVLMSSSDFMQFISKYCNDKLTLHSPRKVCLLYDAPLYLNICSQITNENWKITINVLSFDSNNRLRFLSTEFGMCPIDMEHWKIIFLIQAVKNWSKNKQELIYFRRLGKSI